MFFCRVISSEDYQYVVEIILRTTLALPDEGIETLMQARQNLSQEMSKFLLSFTFALGDGDKELVRIAEFVVENAGSKFQHEFRRKPF